MHSDIHAIAILPETRMPLYPILGHQCYLHLNQHTSCSIIRTPGVLWTKNPS